MAKEFNQIEDTKVREQLTTAFNMALANRKRNKSRREVAKFLDVPLTTVALLEDREIFDFNLVTNYIRLNKVELGIYIKQTN
jgi:hypothetical protein